MTLQELFDITLLRTGEFLVPQDKVELDVRRFRILIENALGWYSKYVPKIEYLYINANNTNSRQYVFVEEAFPYGIPDDISDIIPVRISGVVPYYLREFDRPRSNLDIKVEFPWVYRKPVLTLPTNAEFDVKAFYFHRLKNFGTNDNPNWEVRTITENDQEFIDLVIARFLIALGKSRRAFTIEDLPIKVDATELVSEGKDLEKQAKEDIINNKHEFYLAWQ